MPAPRVVRRLLAATVAGGLVLAGLLVPGAVGVALVARSAPAPPTPAALPSSAAMPAVTTVLDRDGTPIALLDEQYRIPVPITAVSPAMQAAVVAIEDRRFFDEPGVDPLGTARALLSDAAGGAVQGGSTITQQYVKNVYTGDQRTALRKLREASLAIRLEQHLSKDEILTRYLNTLYLGSGTAGVQAASRFYFGVPIQDLDLDPASGKRDPSLALARAAVLAGIAPAPSDWNPVHDPKAARKREIYVLNRMIKNNMISSQQASLAYGSGLPRIVAQSQPDAPTIAPEFRDLVERRLKNIFTDNFDNQMFASGGVKGIAEIHVLARSLWLLRRES